MTAPQDQFTDVARRSQEAITTAMQTWNENVQRMIAGGPSEQSAGPSPEQIVDNVFDFAEQLLASQREFAKRVLTAGTTATKAAPTNLRESTATMTNPV